jgi:hypothetical protein
MMAMMSRLVRAGVASAGRRANRGAVHVTLLIIVVLASLAGCMTLDASPEPSAGPTGLPLAPSPSPASATASPTATASLPLPTSTPVTAGPPARCPGTDRTPGAAAGRQLVGVSQNWSGYVAAGRRTGVTCVEASWIEPAVTCPAKGSRAVAIWIGIDGFSSSTLGIPSTTTLIQIGTQASCQNGVLLHAAWREVLPAEQHEVQIPGKVSAGDHISARVLYTGGHFVMTIFDAESELAFSISATAPGAPRKSAEWIVEAPATTCPSNCRPIALPKFASIRFTNAHATIAGQRSSINDDSWTNVRLRMSRAGILRTTTSTLSLSGTSFRVTFVHS